VTDKTAIQVVVLVLLVVALYVVRGDPILLAITAALILLDLFRLAKLVRT
jgi:hypothetical protein